MQTRGEMPLGLFRSEAAALRFLSDAIMVACEPQSIWLFGSRARGDARDDSDIDLLVVVGDDRNQDIEGSLYTAVAAGGLPTDILVCSTSEFRSCGSLRGSIVEQVHAHGRRLYADKATLLEERARARVTELA